MDSAMTNAPPTMNRRKWPGVENAPWVQECLAVIGPVMQELHEQHWVNMPLEFIDDLKTVFQATVKDEDGKDVVLLYYRVRGLCNGSASVTMRSLPSNTEMHEREIQEAARRGYKVHGVMFDLFGHVSVWPKRATATPEDHNETPAEFAQRIRDEVAKAPGEYFARYLTPPRDLP